MSRYLIGIDLGTTNSALAFIEIKPKMSRPEIRSFAIPQLVAAGEMGSLPLLPSYLYLPGAHDLPPDAASLPWAKDRRLIVGEFARQHGARVPGRLASSAKSWLCHAGVDRTAPLLPWAAPPDVTRISPVDVSTEFLRHLIESWNATMAARDASARLEKQTVVLTVPASFDDVARNLTLEAAKRAGFENVTLLEEPQAAFYCWLANINEKSEPIPLQPGATCVVIDVGGGTSDFSLIQAVEQQGELAFVRLAVGDHLLLGGDNMDLALAKFVESKLQGAGRLDAGQFGMLTQACRIAKEKLLSDHPPERFPVAVMGRGHRVIGSSLHAEITAADVRRVLFDEFFPDVEFEQSEAKPARPRTGLHEMGLPYVSEPAVTRHLAAFLHRHMKETAEGRPPDAVLFNGGVFQPAALRQRVLEVMKHWFDRPDRPWQPLVFSNDSLELAVSRGAAYSAWLRHIGGRRIGGGIARSYYVAVADHNEEPDSESAKLSLLCIVPQRLEEGVEVVLEKPELELALGQPVLFPLYTSTVRGHDQAGQVIEASPGQLLPLPPLHTILRGGKRSGTKRVPVQLAARCTEIGTLELWCVAREGNQRWRLEFNVRDIVRPGEDGDGLTSSTRAATPLEVLPEEQMQQARELIEAVFLPERTSAGELKPRDLTKALEKAFAVSRDDWPTGLCRRLWDFLAEVADQRRQSPAHLSRWYNLTGYCLRPGFGDALDSFRVEQLWKLIHAPHKADGGKATAPKATEGGAEFWIMWRRVAGGLHTSLQTTLFNRLRPYLLPARGKAGFKPHANELAEMWRTAASLERLDVKQKEMLGDVLLKSLKRSPTPTHGFWSLTRLGARVLFYGPLNCVVHPDIAERWLDAILDFQPGNESERLAWAFCLAQLARQSGQRALDISDRYRDRVREVVRAQSVPDHWVRIVEEFVPAQGDEQSRLFGESLPIGLRLVAG
ncbi:MAG: molecular chaperone DnaK [Gemmatales bacterium]|nr:MAG: molecular chaperone DnaK [Gemmatales bacterium]